MKKSIVKRICAGLLAGVFFASTVTELLPENNIFQIEKTETVYAAVTAPGGEVKLGTANAATIVSDAKSAFGSGNITASYSSSTKTLTITLNADIQLAAPVSFAGTLYGDLVDGDYVSNVTHDKVVLKLNSHTITGADGIESTDETKAEGKAAIEVTDPMILDVKGPGNITGGKGGVYLGAQDGTYNCGATGGAGIMVTGEQLYGFAYRPDELTNGVLIEDGATVTGGAGGDVTYAHWQENLDYSYNNGFIQNNWSDYLSIKAGKGGAGIGALDYTGYYRVSFGYVKVISGSVIGGAGGDALLGNNETSYVALTKMAGIKQYVTKKITFSYSKLSLTGGAGGSGIETSTGRRYINTKSGTSVIGGNGGKVVSSAVSEKSNRINRMNGTGGDGITFSGDLGLKNTSYNEATISKSEVTKENSPYAGIVISGEVRGGNSPASTARCGSTSTGGAGIGTGSGHPETSSFCFDNSNLGAIYVTSTGTVTGGDGEDAYWGSSNYMNVVWGYIGAGIGLRGSSGYLCPKLVIIDGTVTGGSGGNARCGIGGKPDVPHNNYGVSTIDVCSSIAVYSGKYGQGRCAFYPGIGIDSRLLGTGKLIAGETGYTYQNLKAAYVDEGAMVGTTAIDSSDIGNFYSFDASGFTGTKVNKVVTEASRYKALTKGGSATITANTEAKAKTGNVFTCTVKSGAGTGTPYYDWRYSDGSIHSDPNNIVTYKYEPDLMGDGTNKVTLDADISAYMNYMINGQNTVKIYCYVVYEDGTVIKSNEFTLAQGETAKDCKVTFNVNGGEWKNLGYQTQILKYKETYYLGNVNSQVKRENYTLIGWNTKADGSGKQYSLYANVDYQEKDFTLYAQWRGKEYDLYLDANGGNALSEENAYRTVYYGDKIGALPTPTHSNSNKTFIGWYSKKSGGKKITSTYVVSAELKDETVFQETNYNYTGRTALYAHWGTAHSITYYLNGGTNNAGNPSTFAEEETLTLKDPTRKGYTFEGWYTSSNFSGTKVTTIAKGTKSDVTLYAKWTAISYTVSFDGNGNTSGETTTQTFKYDVAQNLKTVNFERTGHELSSWNTKADGTGTTYALGASVKNLRSTAGTVTLYAQWTPVTMVVSFDTNEGGTITEEEHSKTVTYGQAYGTLPIPTSTNENYEFAGWFTAKTGGTEITAATIVSKVSAHTLYAHWGVRSTITYELNGGVNNENNSDHFYDCDKVTLYSPSRTGYIFGGWHKDSLTGPVISEIPAGTTENYVLYASWTPITYNIVFKVNGTGFSGTMNSLTGRKYGTSYTLPAVAYKKTGYTFAGWTTKSDGTGTLYKNKASVKNLTTTQGKTVYLYAKWTKTKYAITYKLNGGTNGKNPAYYYITSATFTLKNPTKAGYTFKGWYTDSKFKKKFTSIKKGSHAAVTVYAKWQANTYTIVYEKNGATSGSMKKLSNRIYGKTYTLTKNAYKRKGYTFLGWATSASNAKKYKVAYKNGAKVKNLTTKNGGTVKLYAVWVNNTQKFSLNYVLGFNEGVSNSNPKTYTYLTSTIKLKAPVKKGYKFLGWYTSTSYKTKVTSIPKGSTGNKILVAKWEKIEEPTE